MQVEKKRKANVNEFGTGDNLLVYKCITLNPLPLFTTEKEMLDHSLFVMNRATDFMMGYM